MMSELTGGVTAAGHSLMAGVTSARTGVKHAPNATFGAGCGDALGNAASVGTGSDRCQRPAKQGRAGDNARMNDLDHGVPTASNILLEEDIMCTVVELLPLEAAAKFSMTSRAVRGVLATVKPKIHLDRGKVTRGHLEHNVKLLSVVRSHRLFTVASLRLHGFHNVDWLLSLDTSLEKLVLSGHPGVPVKLLAYQASLLSRFKSVVHLELPYMGLRDASPIGQLTSLAYLDVSNNLLESFAPFAPLVALKTLKVGGRGFEHEGVKFTLKPTFRAWHIEDVASIPPALVHFVYTESYISDAIPFAKLTSLTHLDVSGSFIRDTTPFETLAGLKRLDVHGTVFVAGPGGAPRILAMSTGPYSVEALASDESSEDEESSAEEAPVA